MLVNIGTDDHVIFAETGKVIQVNIDWFEENTDQPNSRLMELKFVKGKIKKADALAIFNEIYPDKQVSIVTLAKQLKMYGINSQRIKEGDNSRIQYFVWDSCQGEPGLVS